MKKGSCKLFAVILTLVMIIGSVSFVFADDQTYFEDVSKIKSNEWMKYIPDNAPIVEVNIPGTHNAACRYFHSVPYTATELGFPITIDTSLLAPFAKTQNLSIPEQMNAGVRVMDVRVTLYNEKDNYLTVPHNMNLTADKMDEGEIMKVDTVIKYAEEFVKRNPSETMILIYMRDGRTYDTSSEKFLQLEKQLDDSFANNPNRIFLKAGVKSPTMAEARGKVILMSNGQYEGAINTGLDLDGCALSGSVRYKYAEKYFNVTGPQNYNYEAYMTKGNGNASRPLGINTSARGEINELGEKEGFGIPLPEINAMEMNDSLMKYNFIKGNYYGWFTSDFVTEELCKKIYLLNNFDPAKFLNMGSLRLTPGKKKVTVKYSKVDNAKQYQIWRSKNKNSGFKKVATVTGTKWTNSKLKSKSTYYYKVRAINGNYTGAFSSVKKIKTK